ncbi:MAG TPA: ABC transporter ATP-binding protein [Longimicrobiales bacterium]|nr:ABC transporter ATP-binding protein [Longimicrobiales bacterium]
MIQVRGLTKRYADLTAVDGLTFDAQAGEIVGLVGPNGAGKTTTLRCVTGIIPVTAGTVTIAGHSLQDDPVAAKRAIAFVPDEPQFFEHLTADEHLQFTARLYNVADAGERGDALLRRLEIDGKRGELPAQLSRGMRQKLAIACALLHRPRALLFDEPLTGLDPAGIRRMKATIRQVAEDGAAVVLSSHLLQLVEELASRILVMAHARIVASGTISDIVASRPELVGKGLEDVFLALTGTREDDDA